MAFVVEQSEVIPGCDPLLGSLPLGAGSMQKVRKFPDEETRDAVLAHEAQQRYIMEMKKIHTRLVASKAFFDKHKHVISIEADDGRHIATGKFPDFYAVYSQTKEDNAPKGVEFFHSFEGREFCITEMKHLPTMERIEVDVRTYCAQAGQPMSSQFARSQVMPGSDGPKDVILEAEFTEPIPLVPDKAFRVVVRGADGTDGTDKRTSVLPSEVFLKAAQDLMDKRIAVIERARAIEQRIGASDFQDVELLTTANAFTMCTDHEGAGYCFQNDKPINFQHENHAIVSDFKLVMFREAPALASVSVAIRF